MRPGADVALVSDAAATEFFTDLSTGHVSEGTTRTRHSVMHEFAAAQAPPRSKTHRPGDDGDWLAALTALIGRCKPAGDDLCRTNFEQPRRRSNGRGKMACWSR